MLLGSDRERILLTFACLLAYSSLAFESLYSRYSEFEFSHPNEPTTNEFEPKSSDDSQCANSDCPSDRKHIATFAHSSRYVGSEWNEEAGGTSQNNRFARP